MKETKVYVDELPKSCGCCEFYSQDKYCNIVKDMISSTHAVNIPLVYENKYPKITKEMHTININYDVKAFVLYMNPELK